MDTKCNIYQYLFSLCELFIKFAHTTFNVGQVFTRIKRHAARLRALLLK